MASSNEWFAGDADAGAHASAGMNGGTAGAAGRVLVVDDDPTVSEVVAGYLERAGFTVHRADDGPSALEAAARYRPDLVVLDLMLPGMDGLEGCRRLRAHGAGTPHLPVVMLTARGDEEDRILGLEVGADDYVTKPFSPRELVLRVRSVLRRASAAVPAGEPLLSAAGLTVDPVARRATRDGVEPAGQRHPPHPGRRHRGDRRGTPSRRGGVVRHRRLRRDPG